MAEQLTPKQAEQAILDALDATLDPGWSAADHDRYEAGLAKHREMVRALHPVSDATPDLAAAGRWRRDGWHDTACWQAWIADPERGCICA